MGIVYDTKNSLQKMMKIKKIGVLRDTALPVDGRRKASDAHPPASRDPIPTGRWVSVGSKPCLSSWPAHLSVMVGRIQAAFCIILDFLSSSFWSKQWSLSSLTRCQLFLKAHNARLDHQRSVLFRVDGPGCLLAELGKDGRRVLIPIQTCPGVALSLLMTSIM